MIITQVHLELGTRKGHSKMCSFATQHNATDVLSFKGLFNWHADCRNVQQSCCQTIECSFLMLIWHLQRRFREFGSTSNRPHNCRPCVWRHVGNQRIQQHVPVSANIQELRTAIVEEWDNITQATINSLINFVRRTCVALHEANGGPTRNGLVFFSTPLPFLGGVVSLTNICMSVFSVMWNP